MGSNAPAKTAPKPSGLARWDEWLESIQPGLQKLARKHIKPETLCRLLVTEMRRTPKIAECSKTSIEMALITCAQLGLEPATPMGHAYLIPYKNFNKHTKQSQMELQLLVGYKGLLELARRTGEISRIAANVVYREEVEAGRFRAAHEPPRLEHDWSLVQARADEDLVAAYCVVETQGGARYTSIIDRAEIDSRRARSRAKDSGPWVTDYAAMARKSAVRALLGGGTVPMSADLASALDLDADSAEPPRVLASAPGLEVVDSAPLSAVAQELEDRSPWGPRRTALERIFNEVRLSPEERISCRKKAGDRWDADEWTDEEALAVEAELDIILTARKDEE